MEVLDNVIPDDLMATVTKLITKHKIIFFFIVVLVALMAIFEKNDGDDVITTKAEKKKLAKKAETKQIEEDKPVEEVKIEQ